MNKTIITLLLTLGIIGYLFLRFLKEKKKLKLEFGECMNLFLSEFLITAGISLMIYLILTYMGFTPSSGKWYSYLILISLAFLFYILGKITLKQTERDMEEKIKWNSRQKD